MNAVALLLLSLLAVSVVAQVPTSKPPASTVPPPPPTGTTTKTYNFTGTTPISTKTTETAAITNATVAKILNVTEAIVKVYIDNATTAFTNTVKEAVATTTEYKTAVALTALPLEQAVAIKTATLANVTELNTALDKWRTDVTATVQKTLDTYAQKTENVTKLLTSVVKPATDYVTRVKDALGAFVEATNATAQAAKASEVLAAGALAELKVLKANAVIYVLNNTIATKNNSYVGDALWPVDNATVVASKIADVVAAVQAAEYKYNATKAVAADLEQQVKEAVDSAVATNAQVKANTFQTPEQIKTTWSTKTAANVSADLEKRAAVLIAGATDVVVKVENLGTTAPTTVKIDVVRDPVAGEDKTVVKTELEQAVKAVVESYTVVKDNTVTVAAVAPKPSVKRVAETWSVSATIPNTPQTAPAPTAPATLATLSFVVALVAVLLAVF